MPRWRSTAGPQRHSASRPSSSICGRTPPPTRRSSATSTDLAACLDTADAYGVTLTVETLQGVAGTPLANVRLAIERDPRTKVTLDSEFLGFHGQLLESISADWLWEDRRVRHVHLKDFDGRMKVGGARRYLLPGEGTLDLQGFINGLLERGYDGAITLEGNAVGPAGELDEARLQQIAAVVKQLSGS